MIKGVFQHLSVFSLRWISHNSILTFYFLLCISREIRDSSLKIKRNLQRILQRRQSVTVTILTIRKFYELSYPIYPNRAHVFLLGRPAVSATLPIYPLHDVPGALRGRYNVKRRRDRSTLLEIADPEFASREFPLDVSTFLITSIPNCPAN